MPAMIQRLETKKGTVYDMSEAWPGTEKEGTEKDPNAWKVGPIFLIPSEEESVVDDDDEDVASVGRPAHYEIWCVTDRTLSALMGQLRGIPLPPEELQFITQSTMTRRIIYLDQVSAVDEDWAAIKAFKKLVDRFVQLGKDEEAEVEAEAEAERQAQQPAAAAPAPTGNGTSPTAG